MNDPILETKVFNAIITVLVALGTFWVALDLLHLSRLRGKDMKDPVNRDKRFGYTMGVLIGCFTTVGILRFHGVV